MTAVNDILAEARINTGMNVDQVSVANGVIWLNRVYKNLCEAINELDETYFYNEWLADGVASQAEYKFPAPAVSTIGMKRLLRLEIKTSSSNTYYTPAKEVDIKNLDQAWGYYQTNQSRDEPIYHVGEDGFFIAPTFTSATVGSSGNNQLKIYGVASVADLAAAGAESTILIDRDYHWLLSLGLEYWIYKSKQKTDMAQLSLSEFNNAKAEMLSNLSNRDRSGDFASVPSGAEFE